MIVRTYGRRKDRLNKGTGRSCSDSSFSHAIQESAAAAKEEEDSDLHDKSNSKRDSGSQDKFSFSFSSSQDSSPWTQLDPDSSSHPSSSTLPRHSSSKPPLPHPKSNKSRTLNNNDANSKNGRPHSLPVLATSTLMEAQEFGEMMEHADEVNFALDGLKKDQPVRIRRASLLSCLSICETAAQRRMLRAQGEAGHSRVNCPKPRAVLVVANEGNEPSKLENALVEGKVKEAEVCVLDMSYMKLIKEALGRVIQRRGEWFGIGFRSVFTVIW